MKYMVSLLQQRLQVAEKELVFRTIDKNRNFLSLPKLAVDKNSHRTGNFFQHIIHFLTEEPEERGHRLFTICHKPWSGTQQQNIGCFIFHH